MDKPNDWQTAPVEIQEPSVSTKFLDGGGIQASSSDSHTAAPMDEPNDWQKA